MSGAPIMRCVWRLLVLMVFLAASVRALAVSDQPASDDPQAAGEQNRRLLEKWRADPDHFARLKRDHAAFLAMPPERQARLRRVDHDLHAEDPATQARLSAVLERYVAWLDKLDDGDRAWIESAPDAQSRLDRVRTIRDKQWVKRLPRQQQEDLATLPPDKQPERITVLRREERQRRLDWFWASHGRDAAALKRARPTRLAEFPPEVRLYWSVSLGHVLPKDKRERLNAAEGNWPLYARTLASVMEAPPLELPGFHDKVWSTKMQDLPKDWRFALNSYFLADGNGQKGGQKKALAPDQKHRLAQRRQLNSKADKWPDYAVEATRLVRAENLKVESQLGPSKVSEFPFPAIKFAIENELLPKITEAERKDLASKEGKWPDYPQRLFELARQRGVTLPGLVRPCPPEFWDAASKLLPDVPDRALRNFALNELTPDERSELRLSLDDASSRDRLLEQYWARHAAELKRQLNPGKPKRP